MGVNEWSVPQLEEPERGTVLQDDTGRVWVRGETRWSTPGQVFNLPTWPQLLATVKRLRRLVPAEPDNTPSSPDLSTDGDGLDLVTHLREEYRTQRDEYDALRGQLASIVGLSGWSDDDEIVSAVRYLREHR